MAYIRSATPMIFSSNHPYIRYSDKKLVIVDAPNTNNTELPQQMLHEIRIPIIPPINPT